MVRPGARPLSRRDVLRAVAALPAAGAVGSAAGATAGCAAGVVSLRPTVRVAVTWSAGELRAFRSVLDSLGPLEYDVDVIPFGDDIDAALGTRATGRPDVVMLPRPGQVQEQLHTLAPLPRALTAPWPYADIWDELLLHPDPADPGRRVPYGLPFKIAHKSAVWYREDVFHSYNIKQPKSWSDWLDLNAKLIREGVTPLALAGGDGWMLTDFFENVLLGSATHTYDRLAGDPPRPWTSSAVVGALRRLGRMWSTRGALAGGVRRSLVLQYPDAVLEVFRYGRAAMVVAPDFAEFVINRFATDRETVGVFSFPRVDGDRDLVSGPPARPVVVGGDVAVLTKPAGPHAADLVTRLARSTAPRPWINLSGGFIAANPHTGTTEYSRELDRLADQLRLLNVDDPAPPGIGPTFRFDLSDQIGAVGSHQGLWRVLQDFLVTVGDGGMDRVPGAAEDAARRLRAFEDRLMDGRNRGRRGG